MSHAYDSAFPGENWFFYWKCSPTLWEGKLKERSHGGPLFVPLYWGFHVDGQDNFDFADTKPETDLKKLYNICRGIGREVIFFLPLVPLPFLPNGGVPSNLCRMMSLSSQGVALATVDSDEKINKIYSFYDPKIYQAYRKFVWHLSQYFTQSGIQPLVFGLKAGFMHEGRFCSFLEDSSPVYEQAFNRYLKQQTQNNPETANVDIVKYRLDFNNLINELYLQSAKESLATSWGGEMECSFLGGGLSDLFARSSSHWESPDQYFENLFESVSNKVIPSSVLLSENQKAPILTRALTDFLTAGFLYKRLDTQLYEDDYVITYEPLVLFEIYFNQMLLVKNPNIWENVGLLTFLKREFKWGYNFSYSLTFNLEEDYIIEKAHFFSGAGLKKEEINKIIKLFLMGARIVLETSDLSSDMQKKLELFFIENNLKIEIVNYGLEIKSISLAEGKMILFDSTKLIDFSLARKITFWESLSQYLSIKNLKIEDEDDIYYYWKFRSPKANELKYEQIRRLSLYNPGQTIKRARVLTVKNFALIKVIDELNSKVKSTTMGIDLEISPGGSVSLDFGYYE